MRMQTVIHTYNRKEVYEDLEKQRISFERQTK